MKNYFVTLKDGSDWKIRARFPKSALRKAKKMDPFGRRTKECTRIGWFLGKAKREIVTED